MSRLAHIPEVLRAEALAAGLSETDTLFRWAKYTCWHAQTYGEVSDFRLVDWRRHIKWELEERRSAVKPLSEPERERRRQQLEDEARKEAEAEDYDGKAMPLSAWVETLPESERTKVVTLRQWLAQTSGRRAE